MSVENSALHPVSGHILDPTPIAQPANPADQEVAGDRDRVIRAFLHASDDHLDGLAGMLEQFRNNGLGGYLSQWAQGHPQEISPEDVQQGLGEDALLIIANRAGVSQLVARTVLSAVLPQVVPQVAPGGKPVAAQVSNRAAEVIGSVR